MRTRTGRNANRPTNVRRRERERARISKKVAHGETLTNRESRLYGTKVTMGRAP